ncbi:MAG: HAD hydrolase-like protein [Clostridia bacterium]|nr:HAD hydrolase-like protein [Clostridia bacterium]
MPQYTHAFFDLDGTVTNSAPGITASVRYAMQKLGRRIPDGLDLTAFIGPPLLYGFSTFCKLNDADTVRAVALYRENYRAGGMLQCDIYPGIQPLLQELNTRGTVCVLATCKPHEFATQILAHLGLSKYFALVSGPEMDGTRNEKDEVIAYALKNLRISDPAAVLMVGDRDNDVLGAKKNGIDCVGVRWGFGSEEELLTAGAIEVISTPDELLRFFPAP